MKEGSALGTGFSPPVPLKVAAAFERSLQGHVGILFCSYYRYLGNVDLFW